MTPIEQAKALAAYWRYEGRYLEEAEGCGYDLTAEYAAKARKTADLLDKLISELERP